MGGERPNRGNRHGGHRNLNGVRGNNAVGPRGAFDPTRQRVRQQQWPTCNKWKGLSVSPVPVQ